MDVLPTLTTEMVIVMMIVLFAVFTFATGLLRVDVAAMLIMLPFFRDYWIWLVLRFVMGLGASMLFTAGDTWINQILDDRVRGRWLGVYSTVGMAGWAVGQAGAGPADGRPGRLGAPTWGRPGRIQTQF